ncbi:MAG: molybdopterin-dependent oxidoreductase [Phycisphaerales bacterium]|nr:molybdopterin-dependent oxidoreductase [Phycisphaerales bacterium]
MPTITLDGQALPYEGKKTILQVAIEHGLEIPHYCYHPGLSIVASCRICLAEVAQPNPRIGGKLELIPKLLPTCQTPASDGMVVYTKSPKSVANQKAVMEYLLINHPLDCPVCDQAGECSLQDYSYQYGRTESRFEEDKIKQPVKDIGPHVKLYSDRCIMCSRCVRFTKEVTGTGELGIFGRGSKEQIDIFPGRALQNELSGNVVDICPVGALLDKDFLFTQRVWFLTETPSIDGLTAGGDNITVHHNEGKVYRVKPRANAQVNQWWISDEIRYGWKFVHSEDRLKQPMRQQYGSQVQCDWARAYEEVLSIFKAVTGRGKRTALLLSPMLTCEDAYLLCQAVRAMDSQAVLGIGPVPKQGEDKTFPGGYKVRTEKAPNARGVLRVIESFVGPGNAYDYTKMLTTLKDATWNIEALVLTGNYPSKWTTKDLTAALAKKQVILLDTLPNDVSPKADLLLPTATWVEKAGTFENDQNRLQCFAQAITPLEITRSEAQIAMDLLALARQLPRPMYDPVVIRKQMGGVFISQVHEPAGARTGEMDMQFVEL